MNKNKQVVPRLRFKDKDGKDFPAWEQCKLKNTVEAIVAGGDIDKDNLKTSGNYPVIGNALTNDGIIGYYDKYYRIEAPAVTVTGRGDVGVAAPRRTSFTPVVRVLAIKSEHDIDFLSSLLNTYNFFSESTGVPQLTVPQLSNIELFLPKNLTEEKKIGSLFRKIENIITLHQRKLEQLKKLKKSLLQKMFPKEGEFYPELRFPGFTDAWEQRKLGEIATFINGRAYSHQELLENGKYKVLRVGNFYTNDNWYFSNLELPQKFYASRGDLLYTWSASFGPHIWEGDTVIYHYHIWKVELSNVLDKAFTLQLLSKDKEQLLEKSNGSTMIHITKSGMEAKGIHLPILAEQKKIGNLFRMLDLSLTLHQRKLDSLKKLKQGLLQNMFV